MFSVVCLFVCLFFDSFHVVACNILIRGHLICVSSFYLVCHDSMSFLSMRVVSLEVLMSFYLGFFQILEGSEGEGNRLKITFTSKAGI